MSPSTLVGVLVVLLGCLCYVGIVAGAGVSTTCGYTTDGYSWDLSALTKPAGSYKGADVYYDYRMNVCDSVKDQSDCKNHGDAACQIAQPSGTYVASLGSFSAQPVWSLIVNSSGDTEPASAGLQYTMTNGDICWIAGRQQVRTVITVFRCAETTSETITVEEDQTTCTFRLTLKTEYACSSSSRTSCKYVNPDSGLKWDITSLRKTAGDYVGYLSPNNYSLNLCGNTAAPSGPCQTGGNSICQYGYRGDFIAGLGGFSRQPIGVWSLISADPSLGAKLTFTNGDTCNIAGVMVPRTSIISFYCDPTGPRQFSITSDPTKCIWNFKFFVAEGCPSRYLPGLGRP